MAHDNHAHDHGTGGESHGSVKSYLIGFVLAVVLTVIPFWMVMSGDFSRTVNGVVIAVTGSAGKTSVKQLTASILMQAFNTWMTQGNLNNHIGAPLTLLALKPEHEAAMIELGASGLGEIAYTAQFVKPLVGIITNAVPAHIEGFGSLQGIVETKGELLDFIQPNGTAVLNADDANFAQWQHRAAHLQQLTFGFSESADVRAVNIRCSLEGSEFDVLCDGQTVAIKLPLLGEHNVRNALAVIAATHAAGLSWDHIVKGLQASVTVKGRLQPCRGAAGQRCPSVLVLRLKVQEAELIDGRFSQRGHADIPRVALHFSTSQTINLLTVADGARACNTSLMRVIECSSG